MVGWLVGIAVSLLWSMSTEVVEVASGSSDRASSGVAFIPT